MQHLDGCYERVARAREVLEDLKRRADDICEAKRDGVLIERKPGRVRLSDGREVDAVIGKAKFPIEPVPLIISILVGEIVYHLRTALDYLIYELAQFDAKEVIKTTQFPMEEFEKGFEGRRNSFLKGVSDEHVAAIKHLQPFEGCQWTRVLRELSNSDKHRHHTIVASPIMVSPAPGSTEAILAGQDVNVKGDVAVSILFADGTPVVETLEQLHSEVTQVLDMFKTEFE